MREWGHWGVWDLRSRGKKDVREGFVIPDGIVSKKRGMVFISTGPVSPHAPHPRPWGFPGEWMERSERRGGMVKGPFEKGNNLTTN